MQTCELPPLFGALRQRRPGPRCAGSSSCDPPLWPSVEAFERIDRNAQNEGLSMPLGAVPRQSALCAALPAGASRLPE